MSDIADRVKKIISEQLGVDLEKVTDTVGLTDDLGADSLDLVELTMAFEEEFDIEIPDDEAEAAQTAGDVVRLLEKLAAQNEQAGIGEHHD
jgi:acyl carrier protein